MALTQTTLNSNHSTGERYFTPDGIPMAGIQVLSNQEVEEYLLANPNFPCYSIADQFLNEAGWRNGVVTQDESERFSQWLSDVVGVDDPDDIPTEDKLYLHTGEAIIEYPPHAIFNILRFSTMYPLMEQEEYDRLTKQRVVVCGGSVGGNIAELLVRTGIGTDPENGYLKVYDPKTVGPQHFRLIFSTPADIGNPKVDVLKSVLTQLDPYANIETSNNPISPEELERLCSDEKTRPTVIYDVVDDPIMKLRINQVAHKHGIPVLHITNLGGGRILKQVFPYNRKGTPLFGIPNIDFDKLLEVYPENEVGMVLTKLIVGMRHLDKRSVRMMKARQMGEIVSWAQEPANVVGAAVEAVGLLRWYLASPSNFQYNQLIRGTDGRTVQDLALAVALGLMDAKLLNEVRNRTSKIA